MKGFYLLECLLAMLLMSLVLSAVSMLTLRLFEETKVMHYLVLSRVIDFSTKQALLVGMPLTQFKEFANENLPGGRLVISGNTVKTCWQTVEKRCQ